MAAVAQSAPAQKKPAPAMDMPETKDPEAVRSQLFELLKLSPRFTKALSADATLLADDAYVSRNNPELAEFLRNHPEVVRNPEFYLSSLPNLSAIAWRDTFDSQGFGSPNAGRNGERIIVFLLIVLVLVAMLWIFRIVLENNKWNRLSKMQIDLYSKLLDKCGTNEELLAFFRDRAGKSFFDLSAIEPRTANPLSRVFLPLQFGIVLTLAGGGFLFLRNSAPSEHDAGVLLVLGTLILMLGIGLIISAVVSYFLARRLGLLPQPTKARETSASGSTGA